jgi:phosphoribosylanthranilate isomerase
MKTRIKICGITNLQDAQDAINAGADALGFVFYEPSPRYITSSDAKKIIEKLPPFIQCVGLFVNESASKIDSIMDEAKLDIAQIIQDKNKDELFSQIQSKYIEVIRVHEKKDLDLLDKNRHYLVDAFVEGFGGEGKRIALDYFDNIDCSKLIIAGGLTESNLKELDGFNFYGVDVSSGVEATKGKKDPQKMINFCKAANALSK